MLRPMDELPEARCADCIAYSPEGRDEQGRVMGSCRFRPELGQISDQLPYCPSFQLRKSREGKVKAPPAPKRSGGGRRSNPRSSAAPASTHRTLKNPTRGDTTGEITMDRDGHLPIANSW